MALETHYLTDIVVARWRDGELVWRYPDYRVVLLMQFDDIFMKTPFTKNVEVVELGEACPEWTRYTAERRCGCSDHIEWGCGDDGESDEGRNEVTEF